MLTIAICNEDVPELQRLTAFMTQYDRERPELSLRIRRFQSLFDLIDSIDLGCTFQVCLLDHPGGHPWMNGLSAEAALRQAAPELAIVGFTDDVRSSFLLPSPDDPLRLEARLAKPVSLADLYGVLDRLARERPSPIPDPTLELPTRQGQRRLPFRGMVCLRYRGHIVTCRMENGETVTSQVLRIPFGQLIQPLLQTGEFSWVSASCVVNLAFVEELDGRASTVRMADGQILPVPKSAFRGLEENLQRYRETPRR